jgi:regulator of RNase E activity RraB
MVDAGQNLPAVDPDRLEQEWLQDQDVLANLAENGDRADIPRAVDVSFRGKPETLEMLSETAAEFGFDFLDIEESEDGDPWLFLVREQCTDPESIRSLTTTCLQIEAMFSVEYDGWGCTAQTGLAH